MAASSDTEKKDTIETHIDVAPAKAETAAVTSVDSTNTPTNTSPPMMDNTSTSVGPIIVSNSNTNDPQQSTVTATASGSINSQPPSNEPELPKSKLRAAVEIYNSLVHKNPSNISLNSVFIGYTDPITGDQEVPILNWRIINQINKDDITYFVLVLNNKNRLILWDKRTQLDRLFASGITKPHQTLQAMLQSDARTTIPAQKDMHHYSNYNTNNNQQQTNNKNQKQTQAHSNHKPPEKLFAVVDSLNKQLMNNARNHDQGLCKFYGAGYCYHGPRCYSLHNAEAITAYEQGWLQGKPLPKIALDYAERYHKKQKYNYLLVLDLEGKDEIIEFPCILIDLSLMKEVARFHKWIRPTFWDKDRGYLGRQEQQSDAHINSKSTAISFAEMMPLLRQWLMGFDIVVDANGAFVDKNFLCACCGNWDVKTQIPKQCRISRIPLPKYFDRWMNIKDFALGLYPQFKPYQVKGMKPLMRVLRMQIMGTHHLGMDDTYNISRIVMQFAKDGAVFDHTAYKDVETQRVVYANEDRRVSPYHVPQRNERNNNYNNRNNNNQYFYKRKR
eukprot:115200_1